MNIKVAAFTVSEKSSNTYQAYDVKLNLWFWRRTFLKSFDLYRHVSYFCHLSHFTLSDLMDASYEMCVQFASWLLRKVCSNIMMAVLHEQPWFKGEP